MYTEEHHGIHRQESEAFPSDLRDGEWARLEPLIPKASPGGRPRKTDMRVAMNPFCICYAPAPWHYLPRDSFPPPATVYNILRKFQRDGASEAMWAELHMALRERMSREASPSAAVLIVNRANRRKRGRQRRPGGL